MSGRNANRVALPVLPAAPAAATQANERSAAGARASASGGDAAGLRVGLVTLGCDKNTVDSERLMAALLGAGARVRSGADGADVVVVNTCGFIDVAKEESVDAILDALRLKEQGRVRTVVAVGCLVQRYKEELAAELPGVDLFLGTAEAERLVPELQARGVLEAVPADVPTMERPLRVLSTATPHTSYLKISEGCDHGCAFCAIPLMRGKHRSVPIERLVREAAELEAAGVVELNLISQDTTWYGRDLLRGSVETAGAGYFVGKLPGQALPARPAAGAAPVPVGAAGRRGLLPELLRALLEATGIPWIRLFYMYPSGIYPALLELMAAEPRIVPYLDMPIQHGADAVLRRMRRPERQATIRERVASLRATIPDLALRTTVIVGFPGETEEAFEELLELLEELRFDHVGAFSYSAEEGTPAATMADQVPEWLRRERLERVLELSRAISLEGNEAQIGRGVRVLVDRVAPGVGAVGRTTRQALDLDGLVVVRGAAGVRPGEFMDATVIEASEDDLVAIPTRMEGPRGRS